MKTNVFLTNVFLVALVFLIVGCTSEKDQVRNTGGTVERPEPSTSVPDMKETSERLEKAVVSLHERLTEDIQSSVRLHEMMIGVLKVERRKLQEQKTKLLASKKRILPMKGMLLRDSEAAEGTKKKEIEDKLEELDELHSKTDDQVEKIDDHVEKVDELIEENEEQIVKFNKLLEEARSRSP